MFNEERRQDKKHIINEVKLSKSSVRPEYQEFFVAAENISCIVKRQGFNVCQ